MSDLLFGVMRTIGSGLAAQRRKMESIASNIANAETTETSDGGPYRKKMVQISEEKGLRETRVVSPKPRLKLATTSPAHIRGAGAAATRKVTTEEPVIEAQIVEAPRQQVKMVYDPHHPDANADGYVAYPDINPVEEMVDMITASRAYQANVAAMDAFKSMVEKALEL
jgi:flagellar basal-body rod protein FlgC